MLICGVSKFVAYLGENSEYLSKSVVALCTVTQCISFFFFIVAPYILVYVEFTHQQMHFY